MTWNEAFSWSYWIHSVPGGAHFVLALVALVLGPVIFLRKKGTRFHRLAGYVFVLSMLAVNISALTMYDFTGYPNLFHVFALISLSALLPGFYFLQRAVRTGEQKHLELHARLMMWAYYGLAAAGIAQVLTRILPPLLGDVGRSFTYMGIGLALAGGVCAVVFRYAAKALSRRYPLVRPVDRPTASNAQGGEAVASKVAVSNG